MTYILGINWSDERSACLLADGVVVHAVQEERLDRMSHSLGLPRGTRPGQPRSLPYRSIFECLESRSLSFDDLDLVVVHGSTYGIDLEQMRRQIPIRDRSKVVSLPEPSHHLGHAAAAYFTSGLDEAAVLVVDCFGSAFREPGNGAVTESESVFRGFDGSIELVWRQTMPLRSSAMGLALFYRMVSMACGFFDRNTAKQESVLEYALHEPALTMGLAAHGNRRDDWPQVLHLTENGIDPSDVWPWLKQLGLARTSTFPSGATWTVPVIPDNGTALTSLHRDVARRAQEELERALVHLARRALSRTGSRNLCLGGEVALNGAALERVRQETEIDQLWVHPALATNEGNAIGAALYGWHVLLGQTGPRAMTGVHLGRRYESDLIDSTLSEEGLAPQVLTIDTLVEEVAGKLCDQQLIGWFEGAAELGQRSLGHRSIFADPRHECMRARVNQAKQQPGFRPLASVVTIEQADSYFEMEGPSPYKLRVVKARDQGRELIPAAIHADGTACVQTVTKADNPSLYALLCAFERKSGVAVLLHTSLRRGVYPMVETPAEALHFLYTDMDLDALVVEQRMIPRELLADDELIDKVPRLHPDCWLDENAETPLWCRLRGEPVPLANPVLVALLTAIDGQRSVAEIISEIAGPDIDQEETAIALEAVRTMLRNRAIVLS